MHLTIHYNGWADGVANPRNFTKDRMFHSRYENAYVNAAITMPRFAHSFGGQGVWKM
jgi:hypothetical protein